MSNLRVNRVKVSRGGAMKRTSLSKSSGILKNLNVLKGDILDYGCGYGFDADHFGWSKYDPYYHDVEVKSLFNTIVCINVLSAVSSTIRSEIIDNIKNLLVDDGIAYLCVPRNLPVKGKFSGFQRRPQNYVILTLNSIYQDSDIEIYKLCKNDNYKDKTNNIGE